jgi:hypothetical protein
MRIEYNGINKWGNTPQLPRLSILNFNPKETHMNKSDDVETRKRFEPTPWLIVILILMGVTLVSIIDNCGVA